MKYSFEFKLECVKLYQEKGIYPPTPKGIKSYSFKHKVRVWSRLVLEHGIDSLKHPNSNRVWKPEEKLELISKVKAGNSILSTAISAGISEGQLYNWIKKYDELGYNGLVQSKKGRPPKDHNMKKSKSIQPKELTESEREELLRLRAEVEYYKAENEIIKKEIALREEKHAAQLKAKKQRLSKNSGRKDTN